MVVKKVLFARFEDVGNSLIFEQIFKTKLLLTTFFTIMKKILTSIKKAVKASSEGLIIGSILLGATASFGQDANQKKQIKAGSNTEVLTALTTNFKKKAATDKAEAFKMAKEKGWKTSIVLLDGTVAELQKIGEDGTPVYYTTYNTGAAATTRANTLNSGGSLGLNVNGQGMTVGIWDGGPMRVSHQAFGNRATTGDGTFSFL